MTRSCLCRTTQRWCSSWTASACGGNIVRLSLHRLDMGTVMSTDSLLSLLQFTDALFPAGAYAHSFGLEFCVQAGTVRRSEEHTSELQSQSNLVCRLLLEKKKKTCNCRRALCCPHSITLFRTACV